ncbi:hypothetical protein TNCV_996541 [Trichonephila clavipes]|nr:hypothetical protein TNCV_996541 [Trichonephila clavipes]
MYWVSSTVGHILMVLQLDIVMSYTISYSSRPPLGSFSRVFSSWSSSCLAAYRSFSIPGFTQASSSLSEPSISSSSPRWASHAHPATSFRHELGSEPLSSSQPPLVLKEQKSICTDIL